MTFEDATVAAGRTYWYRLALIGRDGSQATAGPVSVQAALRRVTGLEVETIAGAGDPIEVRCGTDRHGRTRAGVATSDAARRHGVQSGPSTCPAT